MSSRTLVFFNFEKNWIPQCLMGHLTVMTKTSNALTMQCVAPNTVQPGLALPNRKQHEDKIRQVHGFLAHLGPDALWLRGFQGMISPIFSRLESEKKLKKWIHHLERIDGATPISLGFIMAPKTNLPLRGLKAVYFHCCVSRNLGWKSGEVIPHCSL